VEGAQLTARRALLHQPFVQTGEVSNPVNQLERCVHNRVHHSAGFKFFFNRVFIPIMMSTVLFRNRASRKMCTKNLSRRVSTRTPGSTVRWQKLSSGLTSGEKRWNSNTLSRTRTCAAALQKVLLVRLPILHWNTVLPKFRRVLQ